MADVAIVNPAAIVLAAMERSVPARGVVRASTTNFAPGFHHADPPERIWSGGHLLARSAKPLKRPSASCGTPFRPSGYQKGRSRQMLAGEFANGSGGHIPDRLRHTSHLMKGSRDTARRTSAAGKSAARDLIRMLRPTPPWRRIDWAARVLAPMVAGAGRVRAINKMILGRCYRRPNIGPIGHVLASSIVPCAGSPSDSFWQYSAWLRCCWNDRRAPRRRPRRQPRKSFRNSLRCSATRRSRNG